MLCNAYMCARRVFLALSVTMAAASLTAVEVTAPQAKAAVERWLENAPSLGCMLGGAVESVRTCTVTNGAQFHVARIAGGGFVVTSADTMLAPIVAFAAGGDLEEREGNPLFALLRRDFAARAQFAAAQGSGGASRRKAGTAATAAALTENEAKWARLLGSGMRTMSADGDGVSAVSDLRVAPLVQSKWGQEDEYTGPCYNYYTPSNYPCGCVATAGAQIMRYFMWPAATTSIPQFTNPYCEVNGTTVSLTTQGGSYDWEMMPLVPEYASEAERQAIGKLTSDIGICCGMCYTPGGSGIGGYMLAGVLTNRFGYASALVAQWEDTDLSGTAALMNAILSNFDAKLPVMLSLNGDAGGHAVIGDGYGYSDGALFIHINFGWYGISDAWYSPPNLETGDNPDYNYSFVDGFIFNIFTNKPSSTVICSGRVLNADGNPIEGAVVAWRQAGSSATSGSGATVSTDSKGIYALMLQPGQYIVTAHYGALSSDIAVTLTANRGTKTAYPNLYWQDPPPSVGNRCGQDIVISSIASVAAPQFDPPPCLFYPSTNVTITCATSGATIRYTLDGTEPTENSAVYTGPIVITDNAVITAKAWRSGLSPSVAVAATYTYDVSQGAPRGDYFADPIVISGASGSRVVADNSAYTVEPGEPYHTLDGGYYHYQYNTIWYEWTAPGTGTMAFSTDLANQKYGTYVAVYVGDLLTSLNRICYAKWTDGQEPDENGFYYCAPAVATVNVEQGVTYRIVGMVQSPDLYDEFTLTWSGNLTVTPTATPNTPEPIPYAWLQSYFPGYSTADYDAMALQDSDGDGHANWEEYVLQTNPTNASSRLTASIRMENGVPHVDYTPSSFLSGYHAVIKGTNDLGASPDGWTTVTEPTAAFHFFKVVVEQND